MIRISCSRRRETREFSLSAGYGSISRNSPRRFRRARDCGAGRRRQQAQEPRGIDRCPPLRRPMTKESAAKYPCWWPRWAADPVVSPGRRLPPGAPRTRHHDFIADRAPLVFHVIPASARRSQPGFSPPQGPRDALWRRCCIAHAFQIGKLTGIYRNHPRLRCIILRPPHLRTECPAARDHASISTVFCKLLQSPGLKRKLRTANLKTAATRYISLYFP
jgi:hypothetical protein